MPQSTSPHDDTYTADGGSKPRDSVADAEKLEGEFGRYRIEESLGSGAMGIVYRAFDPDLERKVALKVLRLDTNRDARIRFLREARAMAKVSHRNVVAVHEVGSVDGRDFIAMELIEGDNLAEWQRKQQRDPKLVIAAFIAAAQGLAAAHAKGLVHRDFKPHNVLRSEDGRVLVTDFGLARSVEDQSNSIDPMATTQNIPSNKIALALASSPNNELTHTGAMLGTPAYMAPEQWSGHAIGPEADQYALCVALWEGLTGQRPYQGVTLADLRTQVTTGPEKLDGSMIPRQIRRVLLRGMQVDPKKRWPSMAALLHALSGNSRKSSIALIALATVAAAAIVFAVLQGTSAAGCPAAVMSPDNVWSDSVAAALRSAGKDHVADLLQSDFQRWQTLRSDACKLTEKERAPKLSCLDGVLARFASTAAALQHLPVNVANFEPLLTTIDPAVCESATPPQLESRWPDKATAVTAMQHRQFEAPSALSQTDIEGLHIETTSPCLHAMTKLMAARLHDEQPKVAVELEHAQSSVAQCTDDRLRAEFTLAQSGVIINDRFAKNQASSALRMAETAAMRMPEAAITGAVAELKAAAAIRREMYTDAMPLYSTAATIYRARGLTAKELRITDLQLYDRALNLGAIGLRDVVPVLQIAQRAATTLGGANNRISNALQRTHSIITWLNNDLTKSHEMIKDLPPIHIASKDHRQLRIQGKVLDTAGQPVAGASVVVAENIIADSYKLHTTMGTDSARTTITDSKGHYAFDDVAPRSVIAAELGSRRSLAEKVEKSASDVNLVLMPTSTVTGRVVGVPVGKITFMSANIVNTDRGEYLVASPIAPDGTYRIEKVITGKVSVALRQYDTASSPSGLTIIELGEQPAQLDFDLNKAQRQVYALLRGTTTDSPLLGQVFALDPNVTYPDGRLLFNGLDQKSSFGNAIAERIIGEQVPKELVGFVQPGDLMAKLVNLPNIPLQICGVGLSGNLNDRAFVDKIIKQADKIVVKCKPLAADQSVVTLEVPPMPRID